MEAHNHQDPPPMFEMGHNQFSDMTLSEFQEHNFLGPFSPGILTPDRIKAISQVEVALSRTLDELPAFVDWNADGAVTPVKNQLACGSCWAYSAIGAIEGARFLDTGELVSLSEQQLVDCDKLDSGCMGGLMDNAFLFDENNTGLCSEEDYPYAGHKHWFRGCYEKKGLCDDVPHTRVKTFFDVANGTNDDLMAAIAIQPVSVAIEADQTGFQFYKKGVFSGDCGVNVDHGVLAVGYGTSDEGIDYWLVKNSWGEFWGDSGFIKIARESATVEEGTCGILTHASRPQLED
jgi:C1A family cysteine protease